MAEGTAPRRDHDVGIGGIDVSRFEIRDVPRQDTLVVAMTTPPDHIADAMGSALGRAFAAAEHAGTAPAGPPFARYVHVGPDRIEFEAGIPVVHPVAAGDGARPGEIGGCRAAVAMHVGPYQTLPATYDALTDWITSRGDRPIGAMWERYLSDPDLEPDPATWRTEVFVPLRS
jgi:effector-binding domain-containing protein